MININDYIKTLSLLLLLTLPFNTWATTLKMASYTAEPGDTIQVPVRVENFNEIVSFQFSINWDSTAFQYLEVSDFGLPSYGATSFGNLETSGGKLGTLWYDLAVNGVTLADESTLFTMTFVVIGVCDSTFSINFANQPTPQQFVDSSFNSFTPDLVDGIVEIDCLTNAISGDYPANISLRTYPNPVKSMLEIEVNLPKRQKFRINIFNLNGQIKWSQSFESISTRYRLPAQKLGKGLFYIEVSTPEKHIAQPIFVY